MGLEAATFVQDFDTSNPLAGDKKNQGDDHLRLIKLVTKNTLPNADRPFRFPEVVAKTTTYSVAVTDENKLLLCDTSAGSYTVGLPTPTFDGWSIDIVKHTFDTGYVLVTPPSAVFSGGWAQLKLGVPGVVHRFIYTGGGFIRVRPVGEEAAGSLVLFAGAAVPLGHALANGQSLLRSDNPELFAAWGVAYGAVDGAHFNAPDLRDRFIVGAGLSYGLGATGGENTHQLTTAELPAHLHPVNLNTGNDTPDHAHNYGTAGGTNAKDGPGPTATLWFGGSTGTTGGATARHIHPISGNTDTAGSNAGHENRPPYVAMSYIFRLC